MKQEHPEGSILPPPPAYSEGEDCQTGPRRKGPRLRAAVTSLCLPDGFIQHWPQSPDYHLMIHSKVFPVLGPWAPGEETLAQEILPSAGQGGMVRERRSWCGSVSGLALLDALSAP